jgi:hypothetical protein
MAVILLDNSAGAMCCKLWRPIPDQNAFGGISRWLRPMVRTRKLRACFFGALQNVLIF